VTGFPGEWSLELPPQGYGPQGLAAGASASLKVRFSPTSAGVKTAKVRLSSNDPARPALEADLTGEAVVLAAAA
jgi:hypothetical protein